MKFILSDSDKTTVLIRLMVGAVFFSESIQKFLFAETLGSGRFRKIGMPAPEGGFFKAVSLFRAIFR